MWAKLAKFIIKQRLILMILTILLTAFLGYTGRNLETSYDYISVVPKNDPDLIFFNQFRGKFGEDGNIIVVGFQDEKLFKVKHYANYQNLCKKITQIPGVNDVIALPTLKRLHKDTLNNKFDLQNIFSETVQYQSDLDSILKVAANVKFYDGLIYNDSSKATLMAISISKEYLNSVKRKEVVGSILDIATLFGEANQMKAHFAGLPYVRYIMISTFRQEFNLLILLSSLVTCIILFLFFRSFSSVLFTILVIAITAIWTSGITTLFGYKITMLTGMLPALIVVISIPTCIYMFNKYHQEYRKNGNKLKAVSKIIEKIGFVTFMTNANTAVGFFVLLFTDITIFKEFGMVAGVMSFATFIITIIVIPSLLMYLPEPSEKQMMHLDKKTMQNINNWISGIVEKHRGLVYIVTFLVIGISIFGITLIKPIAFMVDDMPEKGTIKSDLQFFEKNFKGIMPLEVTIDLGKKKAAYNLKNLQKLEEFEDYIKTEKDVSNPISILSIIKSATQAFYNDTPENYRLPDNNEKSFLLRYFSGKNNDLNIIRSFVDSSAQVVRFSMKVADLGTLQMDSLLNFRLKNKIAEIFGATNFKVNVTGTSLLFLKGNQFLLKDLTESMLYAFLLISLMMAFMFTDIRMIIISIIPNLIPMLITAGIMGIFGIRMKVSTAVIFSISFGITIDSTIHYLSKFKQEMALPDITVLEAVVKSIKEAGISMIYTSLVLIFGFGIFIFSDFGGTVALGILTCLTLFFATITNMILLPTLLVTFIKKKAVTVNIE
jgi:uncharacterized protein